MKVFKTLVDVVEGQHGQPLLLDTIEWQGTPWLVSGWQQSQTKGFRKPIRIIRPRLYRFERPVSPQRNEDYSLVVAIPKDVLDGRPSSEDAEMYDIVEAPEVELPISND